MARRPRSQGREEAIAVLCLHGLTGSPDELAPLARALDAAGTRASVPLLAGHGAGVAELAVTRWRDWYASADAALTDLIHREHAPVAVIGASAGGLLALRLATERPRDISALVLLATPLRLPMATAAQIRMRLLIPAAIRPAGLDVVRKPGGVDVSDPALAEGLRSLRAYPLRALGELLGLMVDVRGRMARVTQPVMIARGDLDHTVSDADMTALAQALTHAARVERVRLPASGHLVAIDADRELLASRVREFLALR
jgi:carboxylesterase